MITLPLAQTTIIIADHLTAIDSPLDSINEWIWAVAYIFTLLGFYNRAWKNRKHAEQMIEGLAITSIYVLFAASIGFWKEYLVWLCYWPAQQLANTSNLFQIHTALNNSAQQLTDTINTISDSTNPFSAMFNLVTGKLTATWLYAIIAQGVFSLASIIASALFMPYYVLQHVLAHVMFRFAPIAICALAYQPMGQKANTYLATLVSVLLWPLAFAIIAAATNLTFQVAPGSFILPLRALMALVVFIGGTVLIPPTCFYLCAYGGTHIDPISSAVRFIPHLGSFGRR